MKVLSVIAAAIVAVASLASMSDPASAQAVRTWVSGVGDDANPCSRTAPCKTFLGAIDKTAAGGEMNCLDPGSYGALVITKSLMIFCEGGAAGVTATGIHGITVSAQSGDVVVLRGLEFQGLGSGLSGVRFLSGGTLHIDNCRIANFSGAGASGVLFTPSNDAKLLVTNSIIWNNAPASNGGGITIAPAAGIKATAVIENSTVSNNLNGIRASDAASGSVVLSVVNSVVSHNRNNGISATAVSSVTTLVDGTISAFNGGRGIRSYGTGSVVRLSNSNVTGNATGLSVLGRAQIISFLNNRISGNGVDGAPTSTFPQQ